MHFPLSKTLNLRAFSPIKDEVSFGTMAVNVVSLLEVLITHSRYDIKEHVVRLVREEGLEVLDDLRLGKILAEDLNLALDDLDDRLTDYNGFPYIYP